MARVLAISSHVAYGSVGLVSITAGLRALGHEVVALPTVILSNHPGYRGFSGMEVAADTLVQMLDSLAANGWLGGIDAVLTGYLPTPGHVAVARTAVERVRKSNARAIFVCDPVFGDDPDGVYLDTATATAIRADLIPVCDIATPNRFELSWLSGAIVASVAEAAAAARILEAPQVLTTSLPADDDRIANLLAAKDAAHACLVARREQVPHGTGDLMAALYMGYLLNGEDARSSLGRAAAAVEASILASDSADELSLAAAGPTWRHAEALPTTAI
jgi:pyridoxine kinase